MNKVYTEISPVTLLLFLINIIVGTGVFLNATMLDGLLQGYSFFAYLLTGLLVFPILLVTYRLSLLHKNRNMLDIFSFYFKERSSFIVALYAIAKLATVGVALIFSSTLLMNFFLSIGFFLPYCFFFVLVFLGCFLLSYFEYSTTQFVQFLILFLKLIPLLSTILFAFYIGIRDGRSFFSSNMAAYSTYSVSFASLFEAVSMTIFSFAGFEALFSLGNYRFKQGSKIKFSDLLVIGFCIAAGLYLFYQAGVSFLNMFFAQSQSFGSLEIFDLFTVYFGSNYIFLFLSKIMVFCSFASSFGVAHGILYASSRNLSYAFESIVLNKKKVVQGGVFFMLLFYGYFFSNKVFLLQQVSSLGTIMTYLLFVCCYLKEEINSLSLLAIGSFLVLFGMHFYTAFFYLGFYGYILYFFFAILLFLVLKKKR